MSNYNIGKYNDSMSWRYDIDKAGFIDDMIKKIPIHSHDTVVELGAGTAITLRQIKDKLNPSTRYTAVDPSQQFIDFIKSNYSDIEVIRGNADDFAELDIKYDVLIVRGCIHLFGNAKAQTRLLAAFKRQLNPGGRIFIQEDNMTIYPGTQAAHNAGDHEKFLQVVDEALKENDFKFERKEYRHQFLIDTEKLIAMIRIRWISPLQDLTEERIEKLVADIDTTKKTTDFDYRNEVYIATL